MQKDSLQILKKIKIKRLKEYELIIEKVKKILEKDNIFDEDNIHYLWKTLENRPYMRVRNIKIAI